MKGERVKGERRRMSNAVTVQSASLKISSSQIHIKNVIVKT